MKPLRCAEVVEQLPLFVGADLAADRQGAIAEHLRDCLGCRREAASLQQAAASLRQAALAATRADDAGSSIGQSLDLHRAILAAVAVEPEALPWWRRGPSSTWWLATAAAALVAVGFWWGATADGDDVWHRRPVVVPVADTPRVVPYAGPRVRLLGEETRAPEGGSRSGLDLRRELRHLVEEAEEYLIFPPQAERAVPPEPDEPAEPAVSPESPRRQPR